MNCLACFAVAQSASTSAAASPQMITFGIAALAAAGLLGIWVIRRTLSRKRTQALANVAIEMGFTFDGETRTPYLQTALFGKGQNRNFENMMTGERTGFIVHIFDYSFTVGGGKNQQTYTQTVATFSKEGVSLPYFELRPANVLDKVWDAVAHKNIQFETDPEFARRYVLRGALPDKVRGFFAPSLVSFADTLDAHEKWHIEGVGGTLVVYRADKKVSPEQIREFFEKTAFIATGFFNFAGVAAAASMQS